MTTPTPAQQLEEVLALVANYDLLTPQPFMFDEGLGSDSEWCICDSKSNFTGAEMDKQDAIAFSAAVNWLRQHGSRALDALEAVEGAEDCMCSDCNGDGVWHLEPCGYCDGHGNFKMVPAPKTADAVEVK